MDHRWQYGTCAVHAGYFRLQIDKQVVKYLLLFHCSSDNTNAPQCYVSLTLPVLLILCRHPMYHCTEACEIMWCDYHKFTYKLHAIHYKITKRATGISTLYRVDLAQRLVHSNWLPKKAETNCIIKNFMISTPPQTLLGKLNEGWRDVKPCCTSGGWKENTQDFGGETWRKETTGRTLA
jgi:hypothetical protein